jgi:hypoxanthine phosphoribosyltransferase
MAKKRTMNEIRQNKEYYTGNDPVKQECPLDPIEEAKILIVDKITKHFHDVMFEMVNEEMMNNRLFQSQNYLTDEGYELFEDEYFQFYHEHHGDILYEVMKNITN